MNSRYISPTISSRTISINDSVQDNDQYKTPQMNKNSMFNRDPVNQGFYLDGIHKDINKKSISFSQNSPKRYSIPDSFKTPPSPNKFRDPPTVSSILRSKQISQNYERQMAYTPSSTFKATFNEKSKGSISPLINRYAYFDANKNNYRGKNIKNNKDMDSCQPFTIIISFLIASCVVALTLIWI